MVMKDIFISHVEEDAQESIAVAKGLEQAGFLVWYYEGMLQQVFLSPADR